MKIPKIAMVALMAATLAGSAYGQTTIRIAGSTAFRAAAIAGVASLLQTGYTYAYNGSGSPTLAGAAGAGAAIFSGTTYDGNNPVVIKAFWTGSVSGCSDVVSGRAIQGFLSNSDLPSSAGGAIGSGTDAVAAKVDIAFSDASAGADALALQLANSAGKTLKSTIQSAVNGGTLIEAGTQGQPAQAVITFVWTAMAEKSGGALPFTNINQEQAATLVKNGFVPVSTYTGSMTDTNNYLLLFGRNEDSGSRVNAFAEAQTGFGQSCVQWYPSFTATNAMTNPSTSIDSYSDNNTTVLEGGTGAVLSSMVPWPTGWTLNTNTTVAWTGAANNGHSGYIKGSQVADFLSSQNPVTGVNVTVSAGYSTGSVYPVGYLGTSDSYAAHVSPGSAPILTYNGVAYSQAAVELGEYTFWGYEHCYYLSSNLTPSSVGQTFANDLADGVYLTYADTDSVSTPGSLMQSTSSQYTAGVLLSGMLTSRGGEGGYLSY